MTPDLSLIRPLRELLQAGQATQALEACQAQLAAQPDHPDLRLMWALCQEAIGDATEAQTVLEQLLADQPEHVAAVYHCGRLQLMAKQIDEAKAQFNRCIALDPNHAPARTLLAKIESQLGQADQAISTLRTALRADGDYVPALSALAQQLLAQGEVSEAHAMAAKAVQLRPEDAQAQWVMAQVFAAEGHEAFAHQALSNVASAVQPQQVTQTLRRHLTSPDYQRNAQQWQAFDGPAWKTDAAEELPKLLLVAGWPGATRDQWIKALMADERIGTLPPDQAPQRRQHLNLPVTPEALAQLSPTRLRRQRSAYLQGMPSQQSDWALEPLWLEAAALPALVRLFPSLVVVWLDADVPADAPAEWAAEQALVKHLAQHLGVRCLEVSAATATVDAVMQELGLKA